MAKKARKKVARKKVTKAKKKTGLSRPLSAFVGQRVRKARIGKRMSTAALAKKVGLSQAQVSRLETGGQGWRMVQVEKVATILGLPVAGLTAPKTAVEVSIRYANGSTKTWEV